MLFLHLITLLNTTFERAQLANETETGTRILPFQNSRMPRMKYIKRKLLFFMHTIAIVCSPV